MASLPLHFHLTIVTSADVTFGCPQEHDVFTPAFAIPFSPCYKVKRTRPLVPKQEALEDTLKQICFILDGAG